jgi:hypothetical protein
MKFKDGNTIPYFQDFRFFRGIPSNIRFEIKAFSTDSIKLVAYGYGVRSEPGKHDPKSYGCGCLFVQKNDLDRL